MDEAKLENQKRIILAFLERVVQRVEKELGIKGMKYECDEEGVIKGFEDYPVYVIYKESFDPSLILEINVDSEKIIAYIYNDNCNPVLPESLKEELPKVAKELKLNHWNILGW